MIENIFRSGLVRRRMAASQLGIILHRFVLDLRARGHVLGCIQAYAQVGEHFSRWLRTQRVALCQIDEELVDRFVRGHLPHCCCPRPAPTFARTCRAALGRLVAFLREQRLIPKEKHVEYSATDRVVQAYDRHLEDVAGIAPATRRYRRRCAREFLQTRVVRGRVCLVNLCAADLIRYVQYRSPGLSPASLRALTVALRDLMRFLRFRGEVAESAWPLCPGRHDGRTANYLRCFRRES